MSLKSMKDSSEKNKVDVIATIIIGYAWIYLNVPI